MLSFCLVAPEGRALLPMASALSPEAERTRRAATYKCALLSSGLFQIHPPVLRAKPQLTLRKRYYSNSGYRSNFLLLPMKKPLPDRIAELKTRKSQLTARLNL